MNPKAAYARAVRLSNGVVLSGEAHSILALKAISMGLEDNLVSGHVNYEGKFRPMYSIDKEIIPKIKSEEDAIKFADRCSKGERNACERLTKNNKFLQIVVDRWDNLRRLPMIAAGKRLDNGYIYTDGVAHGSIKALHPDITFNKTAADTHQLCIAGFLHDDGRFFDRKQAAAVCLQITGIVLNEDSMISGEEWIPILKDKDDARDFGQRMHLKGYHHAINRIDMFRTLKKNLEHIYFLEIATREYIKKGNQI